MGELDYSLIQQVIEGNVYVMDTYFSGIKEILEKDTSPEKILARIED
ncbi:MAG: hypothetical protein GXY91_07095 [Clostridia bacterium]|nr:hypothetical protein [Clostridia bacterium]